MAGTNSLQKCYASSLQKNVSRKEVEMWKTVFGNLVNACRCLSFLCVFFKETRAFSETQHSCFSEIWPCHWNSCQRQERSVSEVQRCHGTNSRRKSNFYWKRPSSLSCCKRLSFINVRVEVFSRSCAAKALVSGCEDDYLKIFSCITPNQRCKHSCRA